MFRFRMSWWSILIFLPCVSLAQTSVLGKKSPSRFSKVQFWAGVGFVHWNEPIILSREDGQSTGVANYAGPMIYTELNLFKKRWLHGVSLSISGGTASTGQFLGDLQFEDGKNRVWYGADVGVFSHYRYDKQFQFGLGVVSKIRLVNWEPADGTLTITTKKPLEFAPMLSLRILLSARWALNQSFLILGPQTNQWSMFAARRF